MTILLGRGWSFPPRFDPRTKRAVMVEDIDDIEESLHILFSTFPGERIMMPSYGCALRRMLFRGLTESTLTELRELIRKAILFFEPRILLNTIEIKVIDALGGRLQIHLDYSIRTTNTRHNLVFPLSLDQATHPVSVG